LKVLLCHMSNINVLPLLVQATHNSPTFSISVCTVNKQISYSKQPHTSFHLNLFTWKNILQKWIYQVSSLVTKFIMKSHFSWEAYGKGKGVNTEVVCCLSTDVSFSASKYWSSRLMAWNCMRHFTKQTCIFVFSWNSNEIQYDTVDV